MLLVNNMISFVRLAATWTVDHHDRSHDPKFGSSSEIKKARRDQFLKLACMLQSLSSRYKVLPSVPRIFVTYIYTNRNVLIHSNIWMDRSCVWVGSTSDRSVVCTLMSICFKTRFRELDRCCRNVVFFGKNSPSEDCTLHWPSSRMPWGKEL